MRPLSLLRVYALVLALLAPLAAAAAPGTYSGEAPVESQSDEDRAAALKVALGNVIAEQAGDPGLLSRPDVARAVAQAERYMLQYQYRRNSGDGGAKFTLVAQFDRAAVDQMMGRLGVGAPAAEAAVADTPSTATVWIAGIRNANDYARVVGYLAHNNFVRGAQPVEARGDGLLVRLSLATGLAKFLDVLGMERTLTAAGAPPGPEGADASLVLSP